MASLIPRPKSLPQVESCRPSRPERSRQTLSGIRASPFESLLLLFVRLPSLIRDRKAGSPGLDFTKAFDISYCPDIALNAEPLAVANGCQHSTSANTVLSLSWGFGTQKRGSNLSASIHWLPPTAPY